MVVMRASFEGEEQGNSGLRLEALGGAARQCGEECRGVGKYGGSDLVTSEISERDRTLQSGYALNIDISQSASVINQSQHHTTVMSNNQTSNGIQNESVTQYEFPTILKLIVNSTKTSPFDSDDDDSSCNDIAKSHRQNQTTQQP